MENIVQDIFRVGIGFDAHPLSKDRKLIIGGVTVPNDTGLEGHSDGDVLIHSIIDAVWVQGSARFGDPCIGLLQIQILSGTLCAL